MGLREDAFEKISKHRQIATRILNRHPIANSAIPSLQQASNVFTMLRRAMTYLFIQRRGVPTRSATDEFHSTTRSLQKMITLM